MGWFRRGGKVKAASHILGQLILFFYGGGGASGLETTTNIAKKTGLKRAEILPQLEYLCRHDMLRKNDIGGQVAYSPEMDVKYQDSLQKFLHDVDRSGHGQIAYFFEKHFWKRNI
ncbi:MAG TPA: hypothetical protein EYP78_06220 [Candidatus Omnitrophica bacterium]|nr:hypothetical protein [Candidatus Omnitrophota bacterium]